MQFNHRQPVHTFYGGAHLFRHDAPAKLGAIARKALAEHGEMLNISSDLRDRIDAKLAREPIEDLRIDFEDGYGYRPDEEEDAHAVAAAQQVSTGMDAGTLPPYLGIRTKSFHEPVRHRSMRTLRVFFRTLFARTAGAVPPNFVVTLPKVRHEEEVSALARSLEDLEAPVSVELMMETPEAIRNLRSFVKAAGTRIRGAHFGPYDFTASCGVLATQQGLGHPLRDYARNRMLVELSGNGIWLSDGPTNLIPLGTPAEIERAWQTQWKNIQHALAGGFYQGWDLHPAQLPVRYAAVYSFFAESTPALSARLKNFVAQSAQATRVGSVFDDAATAQGLRNFFLRAANCGAITEAEVHQHCGMSRAALAELWF